MTSVVRHRGPDDEGYVLFPSVGAPGNAYYGNDTPLSVRFAGVPGELRGDVGSVQSGVHCMAFGHRRLAVVDLSPGGHQPMRLRDSTLWIVFNGEIYNHVELRRQLQSEGRVFSTASDTEVVLAAYQHWGRDCLHRFNGMFAFVIVDQQNGRVFAARDRFGVKPLYLWRSPAGFVAFASEIKQFSVLPGWQPRINAQRAYEFLAWDLFDHTNETLFDGVIQLRGGEYVESLPDLLRQRFPIARWYTLTPEKAPPGLDAAAERLRDLLTDAVRLRLRSDVPVGSCLSGGLDSSTIVCLMNELLIEQHSTTVQNTFSATAAVKRFDEREYMDIVVEKTGVRAHFTMPSVNDLFASLDHLSWHQDEPFGSTSIFAQWCVFRLARERNVTVVLDGQGADELLAGYHGFFGPHFASLFLSGRWTTLVNEIRLAKRRHAIGFVRAGAQLADMILPEWIRQPIRSAAGKSSSAPDWIDRSCLHFDDRDSRSVRGAKATSVAAFAETLLLRAGLPRLLHWEDRNSMAHSIESRLPFLDFRVVEFCMGLPDSMRLSGATTKLVLRESMRDVLPNLVRDRTDKLGFATPEEEWVRHDATDMFRRTLTRAIDAAHGILAPSALNLLESQIRGTTRFNFAPWRMISFGRWIERFGLGGPRLP